MYTVECGWYCSRAYIGPTILFKKIQGVPSEWLNEVIMLSGFYYYSCSTNTVCSVGLGISTKQLQFLIRCNWGNRPKPTKQTCIGVRNAVYYLNISDSTIMNTCNFF